MMTEMELAATSEEQLLAETAAGFFAEHSPPAAVRSQRGMVDQGPCYRDMWRQMAGLGLTGPMTAETLGGSDLGIRAVGLIAEAAGRSLAATPFAASGVLAPMLLSAVRRQNVDERLRALSAGELLYAVAAADHDQLSFGSDNRLSGTLEFVADAPQCDRLLVVVPKSAAAGIIFDIPRNMAGLGIEPVRLVDARDYGRVTLEISDASAFVVVDEEDSQDLIAQTKTLLEICVAAEALGGTIASFEATLAYVKDRTQFGVAIGSFQALQHRLAHLYCAIELTRSMVRAASCAAEVHAAEAAELACAAMALAVDLFLVTAKEAIQMHGGLGMTDESDVGFFLKRAQALACLHGSQEEHFNRYAGLRGF